MDDLLFTALDQVGNGTNCCGQNIDKY